MDVHENTFSSAPYLATEEGLFLIRETTAAVNLALQKINNLKQYVKHQIALKSLNVHNDSFKSVNIRQCDEFEKEGVRFKRNSECEYFSTHFRVKKETPIGQYDIHLTNEEGIRNQWENTNHSNLREHSTHISNDSDLHFTCKDNSVSAIEILSSSENSNQSVIDLSSDQCDLECSSRDRSDILVPNAINFKFKEKFMTKESDQPISFSSYEDLPVNPMVRNSKTPISSVQSDLELDRSHSPNVREVDTNDSKSKEIVKAKASVKTDLFTHFSKPCEELERKINNYNESEERKTIQELCTSFTDINKSKSLSSLFSPTKTCSVNSADNSKAYFRIKLKRVPDEVVKEAFQKVGFKDFSINVMHKADYTFGFITFSDEESTRRALNLSCKISIFGKALSILPLKRKICNYTSVDQSVFGKIDENLLINTSCGYNNNIMDLIADSFHSKNEEVNGNAETNICYVTYPKDDVSINGATSPTKTDQVPHRINRNSFNPSSSKRSKSVVRNGRIKKIYQSRKKRRIIENTNQTPKR